MTKEKYIEKYLNKKKLCNEIKRDINDGDDFECIYNRLLEYINENYDSDYKLKLSEIKINKNYGYENDPDEYEATVNIEESDAKYNERIIKDTENLSKRYDAEIAEEKRIAKEKERRELQEFIRLKKKFGNK